MADPDQIIPDEFTTPSPGALFTRDAQRLILHALLIAAAGMVPALLGVVGVWHRSLFEGLGQEIPVTVVMRASQSVVELDSLRSSLAGRAEVCDLNEFGPETARDRMIAAGVAAESLDPTALRDQPVGFTFLWRGTPAEARALRSFLQSLTRERSVEAHFDRGLLETLETGEIIGRTILRTLWTVGIATTCLLLLVGVPLVGTPRLGVSLSRTEMLQALALRALVSSLIGWLLLGGVLGLISAALGGIDGIAIWLRLLWIVPVAVLVSPLGLLRRTD